MLKKWFTVILTVLAIGSAGCGKSAESALPDRAGTQTPVEPDRNSSQSGKESMMGAPLPRTLSMRIGGYTTVLVGRRISIKDTPDPKLVSNISGTNSDPNFVGAFDLETIRYDREIVVDVDEYFFIAKIHYPALFNEGRKRVTLRCEVFDHLIFDVPQEQHTAKLIRAAYKKQIVVHAALVAELNKTPQEKPSIYLATVGNFDPEKAAEVVPVYEELTEGETLFDVRKAIEAHPPGTYVTPR
jgi:hypothetical protein